MQCKRNKRPVPDRGSATFFVRSYHYIVYKYDSQVECTLHECQLSYMTQYKK